MHGEIRTICNEFGMTLGHEPNYLLEQCMHPESIPKDGLVSSRMGYQNVLDSMRSINVKGWRGAP
jgi:hypothetical protein